MSKTKVYLSYAGGNINSKNEIDRNREVVANQIQLELEKNGFEVIRDKKDLNYKGSISKFMKMLTDGEFVITLISTKYLTESHYCQIEIREIIHNRRNYYPILTKDIEQITIPKEKTELISKADSFIDKFANENFQSEEKVKFLECKLTTKEFINQVNDEIALKQNQINLLVARIISDNETLKRKRKELVFEDDNKTVFEYVSILEKFDLALPLSLYRKLNPLEWNLLEKELWKEENILGVNIIGSELNTEELIIKLNKDGERKLHLTESKDELIFKILVNCDSNNKQEYNIFKTITLKERYINSIFNDFSLSIESLIIESNKIYPQSKKQTLLYRLLAIHYSKTDKKLMRSAFEKCINLLENDDENEKSGFFLGWADKEKSNGNYDYSLKIYQKVYSLFKNRTNTRTRFNLAIHFYKEGKIEKSISYYLEKFDNQFIFKIDEFWRKFSDTTFFYLKNSKFIEDAKILKQTLISLANYLHIRKLYNLSTYVHNKIKESIEKNTNFKKDLVNSYLNVNLEKNVVKSYIKSDLNKAEEVLNELKNSSISKIEYQGLLIDYFYAKGEINNAIIKGERFIKENPKLNNDSIYLRIANIYFNDKKNKARYGKAKFYYEKMKPYFLKTNYLYAISLLNTRNEKDAIKIFRNYLTKNESNNQLVISNYIACCIRLNFINEASKFIVQKLLKQRKEEYSNSFISFLYQQQLKLTIDKSYSELLLKEALKFSDKDKQKAIVYNRYAEHLISTIDFQPNVFNKPFEYDEIEIEDAISNFKKSIDFSKNVKEKEKNLFSIAVCYFIVNDYYRTFSFLNKIKHKYLQEKVDFLRIQIYFKRKQFKQIEVFVKNQSRKVKIFSLICLARNFKERYGLRKKNISEAVKLDLTYYSKLQQAIIFFSINQKRKSYEILNEILSSNKTNQKAIKEEFENNISPFKKKLSKDQNKKIREGLWLMKKENPELFNAINVLISESPYNIQLLDYKFNYYKILGKIEECETVLKTIINKKLFHLRTSHLFYEISKIYYKKSNYYDNRNPKNTSLNDNLKHIEKAEFYLKYATDDFFSKFKIRKLNAMIAFKKGNFEKHNSIVKKLKNNINLIQSKQLDSYLKDEKKQIKVFLWSEFNNEYYSKIQFYKFQINTVVASIIGDKDQKDKTTAIKILKTISFDTNFHIENNFNLLLNITNRLAHFYFYIKKDYRKALFYQKKIWKKKIFDLKFIGGFLRNITNCKEFGYGVECCKIIVDRNNSALTSRFYGNYLKELNQHNNALKYYQIAYDLALKLPESNIEESNTKNRETVIILNNIALLVIKAIESNDLFINRKKLLKLGSNSINTIHSIDPTFKHIKSIYIENTTKQLNEISKQ